MIDLSALNESQRKAATMDGHVLATACPGSGKTRMLVSRAAHLLTENKRFKLAAVTFTRDAADDLRARIAKESPQIERRVTAGTFHSLCGQQLRAAGYKQKIIPDYEQQTLLLRLMRKSGSSIEVEDVMRYIAAQKATMDGRVQFIGYEGSESEYRSISAQYADLLHERQVFDFGDLIQQTVIGMRSGKIKPLEVQHLLVDEFQDSDDTQLQWVLAHAAAGVTVCAVGDDDQSIYQWRNALGYAGMMAFRDQLRATHVSLDTTYRCAGDILAAAGRLIEHNNDRVKKKLVTQNSQRGTVRVHVAAERAAEAALVARTILDSIPAGGSLAAGAWVVLARTNAQLDVIEDVITDVGVANRRLGGPSLWDSFGGKALLAIAAALDSNRLSCIEGLLHDLCPEDTVADRILKPHGGQGRIDDFASSPPVAGEPAAVTTLRRKLRSWRQATLDMQYKLVIQSAADWLRGAFPAKKFGKSADKSKSTLDLCEASLSKLKGNLGTRLRWIQDAKPKSGDTPVTVMTLHRSKGLEFDHVWLVGCEEGKCPSTDSPLEEERRLFYVGMTRAKSQLHLSYTLANDPVPSCFLKEAGLTGSPAFAAAA